MDYSSLNQLNQSVTDNFDIQYIHISSNFQDWTLKESDPNKPDLN